MATEATEDGWDEAGFVSASHYRVAVLERLEDGPAIPSQIATDADISISHVSRALGRLRERSLVKLLVSDERKKGRVYGITEEGEHASTLAKQLGDNNV